MGWHHESFSQKPTFFPDLTDPALTRTPEQEQEVQEWFAARHRLEKEKRIARALSNEKYVEVNLLSGEPAKWVEVGEGTPDDPIYGFLLKDGKDIGEKTPIIFKGKQCLGKDLWWLNK